jgi:hypothetical protein
MTSDRVQADNETRARHGTVGPLSTPTPMEEATPIFDMASGWIELRVWADTFFDAQQHRIATENRMQTNREPEKRDLTVESDAFSAYVEALVLAEALCQHELVRTYRRITPKPIVVWQKQALGVGEHTLARLLGRIGNPAIAYPHHWSGTGTDRILVDDEPYYRTVSQLWQFCGHGAPKQKIEGITARELAQRGSPTAKMLVHLLAEGAVKAGMRKLPGAGPVFTLDTRKAISPYGGVYMAAREHVLDRGWRPAHQHAHGLRIVGKTILKDLWLASQ